MMNDFEEIDNDKSYTQINEKMYRAHRIVVGHVSTLRSKIQSLQAENNILVQAFAARLGLTEEFVRKEYLTPRGK